MSLIIDENVSPKSFLQNKTKDIDALLFKLINNYYSEEDNIVSDEYFDDTIQYCESKFPDLNALKQIGEQRKHDFIKLPTVLGSEKKTYHTDNKLKRWIEHNNVLDEDELILSAKADGICILIFNDKIYTRGDGTYGRDITKIKKYLSFSISGLKIKGELIIKKNVFKNDFRGFKTARNVVCGELNKKENDENIMAKISFLAHDLIDVNLSQKEKFKILKSKNIPTVATTFAKSKFLNYENLKYLLENWTNELDYDIDGIVIRDNKNHTSAAVNDWSIAYKHTFGHQTGILEKIEWNLTKHGKFAPKALLKNPVYIDGVSINYLNCHNAKYVIDNKLGEGAVVNIERSGNVIPNIVSVCEVGKEVLLPENSYLEGAYLYCKEETDDQNLKSILYFLKYFKYKPIGLKTLEKINDRIKIKNIFDFLDLKNHDISFVGVKTAETLNCFITDLKTKKIPVYDIIAAYNETENVGVKRLKTIFDSIDDCIDNKENILFNKIKFLRGFNDTTSFLAIEAIKNFVENKKRFDKYFNISYGNIQKKCNKINVMFSGFRSDEELESITKSLNIELNIVSVTNADYVIVKDKNDNTQKISDAKKFNKKIFTVTEFISYLKGGFIK